MVSRIDSTCQSVNVGILYEYKYFFCPTHPADYRHISRTTESDMLRESIVILVEFYHQPSHSAKDILLKD